MTNAVFHKLYLIALVVLSMFCSCAGTKQLKAHREILSDLATGDYTPKQRMDGLGNELVIVLDESLSRPTALGTYKHVKKFAEQNEDNLELIYTDIDNWQSDMNDTQKIMSGVELASKSYTRRFITLMPKFKKKVSNKYKQLVFFAKLMKVMNPIK